MEKQKTSSIEKLCMPMGDTVPTNDNEDICLPHDTEEDEANSESDIDHSEEIACLVYSDKMKNKITRSLQMPICPH